MSAWPGLVPRQSSSGDKQFLLGISKRGDRYLRTLLIHGARSVLAHSKNTETDYGRWLIKKKSTLSFNKAAVAVANKVERSGSTERISADVIVNAAGPFAKDIAAMIGVDLPLSNVFQQKLAFDDKKNAVSRQQPFSLDLDDQELDWTAEERDLLAEDPDFKWLLKPILGGAHCRPEGGDKRTWVKLGWAFNRESSEPQQKLSNDPHFNPQFPELILRAASRLNPALKQYCESFPDRWTHYGGYYPMTNENWPLVGPLGVDGAFITGALSGYGCMAACAAGSICASWIADGDLPDYAKQLSLARYDDGELMAEIMDSPSKGIL